MPSKQGKRTKFSLAFLHWSDLNVLRDNWSGLPGRVFFADKAYQDIAMQQAMTEHGTELLSPIGKSSSD